MPEPLILAWSGGKDSTLALHELRRDARYEIATLLTTVTESYDRISIHGVRRSLLYEQAASLRVPLREVVIPTDCPNDEYERRMAAALDDIRAQTPGLRSVAFGDLFLEDIRRYRERMLASDGMRGIFPVWGRDTAALAREFLALGYKAIVVCVDTTALPRDFAGAEFDDAFLDALPPGVDPCGENGEFHTFVYAGPPFARPIPCRRGEIVLRNERFAYCDLEG
jgi:uncharacterized protein (TIGR00290 family)